MPDTRPASASVYPCRVISACPTSDCAQAGVPSRTQANNQLAPWAQYSRDRGGNLNRHLRFLDFTAADIQLSYAVEMFAAWGAVDATRPRLRAFIERSRKRPAYQRVVEVAGPLVPLA